MSQLPLEMRIQALRQRLKRIDFLAVAGDAAAKMAARTGLAASTVSALTYAAGQSGTDIASLENGLRKMQKTLADAAGGSKGAIESLAAIGMNAKELLTLSPDKQFEAMSAAISAIEDPAKRTAAAMEIFGKSGTQLLPLMSSDVKALIADAHNVRRTRYGQEQT